MQYHSSTYFTPTTPPPPPPTLGWGHISTFSEHGQVGLKGQNIFFLKVVILHIKLKVMELRALTLCQGI